MAAVTAGAAAPKLGYRPSLTGLRGVAASLVVVHHLFPGSRFDGLGWLGVAIFYTLSGFLITKLLLEERDRDGRIDVVGFYRRRGRRLLPALWFAVGCVLAFAAVAGWWDRVWFGCVAALAYVGNYAWISGHDLGAVGDTYTLAIEEHFYLVWPWLFPLVARCRHPLRVLGGFVLAVMVARVVLLGGGVRPEYTTGTAEMCADRILIGAGLAFIAHRRPLRSVGAAVPAVALVGLAAVGSVPFVVVGLVGGAVATAALIAAVLEDASSPVARLLASRSLVAVGRVSYGLYLWHYIGFWFASQAGPLTVPGALLVLAGSSVMTVVSWRLVEQPAMRWRAATRVQLGYAAS